MMFLHPFLPQQKLFKAYDIRGDIDLFTDDFLWALANAFVDLYQSQGAIDIVIGYDVRNQSEMIARFLAYACQERNITVHWLGQVTTPIMAFMASQFSGHGLMVTASHSQKHINGIKWLIHYESPNSQDILALYDRLAYKCALIPTTTLLQKIIHQKFEPLTAKSFATYQNGIAKALTTINAHRAHITDDKKIRNPHKNYRLVIDCMNGATSQFAQQLFESLGHQCLMLNAIADGNFPKGNPDPTEAGRLTELKQAVLEYQADLGLAFDGDGDRLMVIDHRGRMLSPDHLLYLLANIALHDSPQPDQPPEVIFDVKCSHHVPNLLAQQGAKPVMEKTGSSLMRKSLQNKSRHSIFAGELSGHFLFNDGYFVLHDDAMYAAARLLNWLQFQSSSLADIIDSLPGCISTADMYLPIMNADAGQTIVNTLINLTKKPYRSLKRAFAINNISTIDGLRLDFAHGFGVLRRSNTGNFLTVRFCGDTLADLQHIQNVFVGLCHRIDTDLAKQMASIEPV